MNFVIGAIGANFTLGLISGISGAVTSVYSLVSTIMQRTANGAEEIKDVIQKIDVESKIRTAQFLLCELSITEDTPYTVLYCVQEIDSAIKEIIDELDKIHYRMQYNNNLWVGSSVRSYKFQNCAKRLHASIDCLENRKRTLITVMSIKDKLCKNDKLIEQIGTIDRLLMSNSQSDPKSAAITQNDLHKKT